MKCRDFIKASAVIAAATAANGGVDGIGVSWGYRPVESLSAAGQIVHSVTELREAILGKFDCHCHILPGLDDGAADLEESLFLCRLLVERGYRPVLAHPERYLWATPADYDRWHAAGAAFQRNLGSVEGFYGDPVTERAKYLQEKGYYSFLGTDLHNRHYAEFFDVI